jgi:hypothetical protein
MAIRHVRAVQEYSQIADDLTRHIVEIIALDIGEDDSPAYTSNRKIAQRARCAVNTARDRIQTAVESGELVQQVEGKYTFYHLNGDLIPYGRTSGETRAENEGKRVKDKLVTADDLAKFKEELYQGLYQANEGLYQRLYQQIVSVVSTIQSNGDTEVKKESIKKDTPTVELSKHFQELSGCVPSLDTYYADWEPLLNEWLDRYGLEGTKKRLTAGVSFARGANEQRKKYTISSPRSLSTIIANLPAESMGQGANGLISVRTR